MVMEFALVFIKQYLLTNSTDTISVYIITTWILLF